MSDKKPVRINVDIDGCVEVLEKPDDVEVLVTYEEDDYDYEDDYDFEDEDEDDFEEDDFDDFDEDFYEDEEVPDPER